MSKWLQQYDLIYNQQVTCYQPPQNSTMTERKIWKAQEDQILKQLYEDQGIKKWSQISKMMETVYRVEGRNGKQCRQRYHNHLKGGINKEKWGKEEEQLLVQLHAVHGNRWALISKLIPGRTENCVKNMLYSKLRKSLRQLNRFSYQHYRKILKEIKISFIYRLIEFTQNSYKKLQTERNQQENAALNIKNRILNLNYDDNQELNQSEKTEIKQLIESIHIFKRVNQRFRGNHGAKHSKGKATKKTQNNSSSKELEEGLIQLEQGQEEQKDQMDDYSNQIDEQNKIMFYDVSKNEKKNTEETSIQTRDTKQTLKEVPQLNMELSNIGTLRSKVSVMRMDSLDSNLSLLLVDTGLQKPIVVQNPFYNLTPTPTHPQHNFQDWTSVISNWKPHITND